MNLEPSKAQCSVYGGPDDKPYRRVFDKSGTAWFYKPGKFAATTIYKDGGKGSQGFGGSVFTFKLEDGTEVESIGPWLSNSEALYERTGVDIRHQYMTKISISRDVEYPPGHNYGRPRMLDVVHHEEDWVESTYERPIELAQKLANELNERLYYYIETFGGSRAGWIEPKK